MPPASPGPEFDRIEYEALVPIYEQALEDDPSDASVVYWLGHAYTSLGRIREGLEMDLRLTSLSPNDPTARYNLACSFALLGRTEEAIEALREAVRLGYREVQYMRTDEDLASLRGDPRFEEILEDLEGA